MDQCSFCALHKGILLKVSSFIQQRYFFWRVSRVSNNSWSSEKALKHQVKVYCHPCIRPSKTQASAVRGTHPQDLGIPAPSMVPAPKYPVLIKDYVASPTADHKTNLLREQQMRGARVCTLLVGLVPVRGVLWVSARALESTCTPEQIR